MFRSVQVLCKFDFWSLISESLLILHECTTGGITGFIQEHLQTSHFTPADVIFSIAKQQNCIYTCLLYFPSHDSFIHVHMFALSMDPKVSVYKAISGKLTKLSRASTLNLHFLSKCSACWVAMPKHQWFSSQQETLIWLFYFKLRFYGCSRQREALDARDKDLNFTKVAFSVYVQETEITNCFLLFSNLLAQQYSTHCGVMAHCGSSDKPCFSDMMQNKWIPRDLSTWSSPSGKCNNWPALVCDI